MKKLISKHLKSTGIRAPVAKGLRPSSVCRNSHCQCDCYECAGGDTSGDND